MRLYEHFAFFLMGALPYILVLPMLLFALYYAELWSTNQVLSFLTFQIFFWFVFANFSIFLGMTGRLCWYLFWTVLVGFGLYIRYTKNYDFDFLGFLNVNQVLYKSDPLNLDLILNYGALCLLLYGSALALSFSINSGSFALIHARETSLSRGLFALYLVVGIIGSAYFNNKFESAKSEFSGLYLTNIIGRSKDFWSSSVQLNEKEIAAYHREITRLHSDVLEFAESYHFELPAIHYQHNPNQDVVKTLRNHMHTDSDLEIEFSFENLEDSLSDTEREVIVENLRFLSRGWIEKEDKLIFLRGLAANWTWRHLDRKLARKRLKALVSYPAFYDQFEAAEWLSIFQNSGSCLFDSLAASIVGNMAESTPKNQLIEFLHTGLNLDHSWVPFHLFRSVFKRASSIEIRPSELDLAALSNIPHDASTPEYHLGLLSYKVDLKKIFPKVYQPTYRIDNLKNEHLDVHIHFYEHTSPGRLVDIGETLTDVLTPEEDGEYTPNRLMLQEERFSTTFSWYSQDLGCRVYSPWSHVEL